MADATTVRGLYALDGPFVTIYLNTDGAVENAAQKIETRWRDVLDDLAGLGVGSPTRDALTAARGDHRLGNTRMLVAAGGEVRLAESWPERTDTDIVRVGPLPAVVPALRQSQRRIRYAVAVVDRRGADVLAYPGQPEPTTAEIDLTRWPEHKTGTGGWAARRYDNTVEESWKATAKAVAELIARAARDVDAEIVAVAGDPKQTTLVLDQLPPTVRDRVREIAGSRAPDGGDGHLADEIAALLAGWEAECTGRVLDALGELRGEGRAVEGAADVVGCLSQGRVATLALAPEKVPPRTAWFGADPAQAALDADDLRDTGVTDPVEAGLVDVVLRAALGTEAHVRILPPESPAAPHGGIGGLLRY